MKLNSFVYSSTYRFYCQVKFHWLIFLSLLPNTLQVLWVLCKFKRHFSFSFAFQISSTGSGTLYSLCKYLNMLYIETMEQPVNYPYLLKFLESKTWFCNFFLDFACFSPKSSLFTVNLFMNPPSSPRRMSSRQTWSGRDTTHTQRRQWSMGLMTK